jgi:two-component system sensor histidine kinase KdpD
MSPRLVRATARLAASLKAEWIAVHVETPSTIQQSAEDKDRLTRTFKLAELLGGETVTLSGQNVVKEILDLAHSRNVTKIILGKPARARWREWLFGSVVNDMARQGGDIDLYIISGEGTHFSSRRVQERKEHIPWQDIGWAAGVVALCTLINWPLSHHFDRVNLAMIYLLGIMWTAYRLGRHPAAAASLLGVLAFDFFFVPPFFTFAVTDTQYIFTFAVMLAVGLSISTLAGRLTRQTEALQRRERRTRLLYQFSRMLSETPDPKELIQKAWKHLSEFYQLPVLIFLPQPNKELHVAAGDSTQFGLTPESMGAVEWVMLRNESAGTGTNTLASLGALYLPLKGLQEPVGVLAIKPPDPSFFQDPEQYRLLETLAGEFGGALESTQMSEAAGRAEAEIETQRLRNLLLTSLSYDLRDPLRRLSRRVHELLDPASPLTEKSREALMKEIKDEADRLEQMAADLLSVIDTEVANTPAGKS